MKPSPSTATAPDLRSCWSRFRLALRGFLHGFVGTTQLPRERGAARHALSHGASRRDRCC